VNGTPVKSGNDLVNPISLAPIGSKVKLTYVRDRSQKEATATVEDRTRVFPNTAGRMGDQPGGEAAPTEFGLHVQDLTPDRAHRVGMDTQKGVLVTEVEPASFAEDIGFAQRDVIAEVNRQAISSVEDYRNAIGKLKAGDSVVFKVLRHQDTDRVLTVFLPGVVPAEDKR
jgi:serine protease Do